MTLDRRELLLALGATAAAPLLARPARGAETPALTPLGEAARDAWIYTLPLIESAGARASVLAGTAPNTLFRLREPTTPATQRVTTPNNDTLNARGWIDLRQGPVRITLPRTGSRYFSAAMMDMYSNNFAVLGTRTTGGSGGTFTVVAPGAASDDPLAIRSPTPWMWVLIRLLTTGGDDLATARAVQDGFRIEGPAITARPPTSATRNADWRAYFASAQGLIVENPPPATDAAMLERLAPLGLSVGGGFDPARFSAAEAAQVEAGVAAARALLLKGGAQGPEADGWSYPRAKLGAFAQDYAYRAQVALNGFAALPVDEAMYMWALGSNRDMRLDSAAAWRLRLPAERLPPVDAFWSLTAYEATPDGQFFLFDNPARRYSIGDRTPGLKRGADGGVEIIVARNPPPGSAANWLPAPQRSALGLVFRCYRPRAPLLDGDYRLPPLERIAG